MILFIEIVIAGSLISLIAAFLVRLMNWLNLSSKFKFLFIKVAIVSIAVAPIVPLIAPRTTVPLRSQGIAHQISAGSQKGTAITFTIDLDSNHSYRWLLFMYLATLGLLFTRRLSGLVQLRRIINSAEEIKGLECAVPIYLSSHARAPFSIGLIKAAIVLPKQSFVSLTEKQIRTIVAHEMIHIRRKDHVFHALGLVLEVIWFFWPFIYIINRELEAEMEVSCDEQVLLTTAVSRRDYGDLLVGFAESQSQCPTFGLSVSNSFLYRRIQAMKSDTKKQNVALQSGFYAILAIASIGISICTVQSRASTASQINLSCLWVGHTASSATPILVSLKDAPGSITRLGTIQGYEVSVKKTKAPNNILINLARGSFSAAGVGALNSKSATVDTYANDGSHILEIECGLAE